MGQTIPIVWVNAFTRQPFGGNPAVVVADADGLDSALMQKIAREVNCSETAFILTSRHPEADLKIRWFTPTQEVKLCGHATVAAIHALCEAGRFNLSPGVLQILYIETLSGVLPVTVDFKGEAPWIWLTIPSASFTQLSEQHIGQIASALLIPANGLTGVVDSLNHDVLLNVESLERLQGLSPNFAQLAAIGSQEQWRGFCVFTTETVDPKNTAHTRFFAPQSGIHEDPVTGSVSAPLGQYLQQFLDLKFQVLHPDPLHPDPLHPDPLHPDPLHPDPLRTELLRTELLRTELLHTKLLRLEQGEELGRPGLVHVSLQDQLPKIGGQAITLLTGAFQL